MNSALTVSLVVTLLNEIETIPALLASIEKQSDAIDEVVFVDGGSNDGTFEALSMWCARDPSRKVIQSLGCNIAEGRNIGISVTDSDVILTTDAGCSLHDGWAARLVAELDAADAMSVKGRYVLDANGTRWSRGVAYAAAPRRTSFAKASALASSRSFGFRREAWHQLGGYPESLLTAEDTLFAQRLASHGRVGFASGAVVSWPVRPTIRQTYRQYYSYSSGDLRAGTNRRLLILTTMVWAGVVTVLARDRRRGSLICMGYFGRRLFGRRSTTVSLTPSTAVGAVGAIVVMDSARISAILVHVFRRLMVKSS